MQNFWMLKQVINVVSTVFLKGYGYFSCDK